MVELIIHNGDSMYAPLVEEGITLEWQRKGVPGKLEFAVYKDENISFQEGDPVRFTVDGHNTFYGYIFTKKRNKDNLIKVTAYDQLRYLKNKDTYIYKDKTATELIKMIAEDFKLYIGVLEDTGYKLSRKEDNKTLFDIIQDALDETVKGSGKLYVLYDNFGKLTLQNIQNMKLDLLICEDTAEDYDYTSSIDTNTYNQVKLTYENEETGNKDVYIAKDSSSINRWGLLQYLDTLQDGENGRAKADALLSLYNKKTRNLDIKGAFGDIRVRAGCSLPIILNIGDIAVQNYMIVDKVKHKFDLNNHTMDLTLIGGDFVA